MEAGLSPFNVTSPSNCAWAISSTALRGPPDSEASCRRRTTVDPSESSAVKVASLRCQASQLTGELKVLQLDAQRHALAADQCLGAIRDKAETLIAQLAEAQAAGGLGEASARSDACMRGRSALEEEVQVMERRLAKEDVGNGSAWAATFSERHAMLRKRIADAESRQASVADATLASTRDFEARLAKLRQQRTEVEIGSLSTDGVWRSRFESLTSAHEEPSSQAPGMAADECMQQLDKALSSAANSLRDKASLPSKRLPSHLPEALQCLRGIARAELRRHRLLTEHWTELHGISPPHSCLGGVVAPARGAGRSFSPPRVFDWDLNAFTVPDRNLPRATAALS